MSKRLKIVFGSFAAVVVAIAATAFAISTQYERHLNGQVEDLFAARNPTEPSIVTKDDLADLPEPVQQWLRYSGAVGKPRPTTVRLKQEGEIRLGDRGWMPFTAEEYYTTDPPGFVWTATIDFTGGIPVIGQDRYIEGAAALEMRLLGVIPVASDSGPEMDEGDLLRYLNETMWFPAGALSPYITWESVDDVSARATMEYGGSRGFGTFFFDEKGRVTNMIADRFDREFGAIVPWSTPLQEYGEFDGIRVPTEGEAVYSRDTGDYAYIRLRVTEIDYDVPVLYQGMSARLEPFQDTGARNRRQVGCCQFLVAGGDGSVVISAVYQHLAATAAMVASGR